MVCNNGCGCSLKLIVSRKQKIIFSIIISLLGMIGLSGYLFLNKMLEPFGYSIVLLMTIAIVIGLLFAIIPIHFLCCPGRVMIVGICFGFISYYLFTLIIKLFDNNYLNQISIFSFIIYGLVVSISILIVYFIIHFKHAR